MKIPQQILMEVGEKYRQNLNSVMVSVTVAIEAIEAYHAQFEIKDEKRVAMREKAISILELVKGFTNRTNDEAMKAALEMTNCVLELTNYDGF